jgi:CRP-like cAMP-binding protein
MDGVTQRSLQAVNFELQACEQSSGYCFFMQGAQASGIFIIQEGRVKVFKPRTVPEVLVKKGETTLPAGTVFGLPPAAKDAKDGSTAERDSKTDGASIRRPRSSGAGRIIKEASVKGDADLASKAAAATSALSADGTLSMAYVKAKLVQVAELGPRDFFGEDCLPEGLHSCTAIASGSVTVLWLRPEAVHHLSSRGISNLMRAADMRRRWRDKQAEVLQANWNLAQAANRETPVLTQRSRSRAIQSASPSTSSSTINGSGSSGDTGGKAARPITRLDSAGTARRNAENAMRETMHLSRWAENLEASRRAQQKAYMGGSALSTPSSTTSTPAEANSQAVRATPPRSARPRAKKASYTRRPATANPVTFSGAFLTLWVGVSL